MGTEDQLTFLYSDSEINTGFIRSYLDDHDIPCFIRNDMQSGISAGFVAALPGSETRIFVKKKHYMKARILLDKYLQARENQK